MPKMVFSAIRFLADEDIIPKHRNPKEDEAWWQSCDGLTWAEMEKQAYGSHEDWMVDIKYYKKWKSDSIT